MLTISEKKFLDQVFRIFESLPEDVLESLLVGVCHCIVKNHPDFDRFREGTGADLYFEWVTFEEEEEEEG